MELRGKIVYSNSIESFSIGIQSEGRTIESSKISIKLTKIENNIESPIAEAITDENGIFIISDVQPGNYKASIDGRYSFEFEIKQPDSPLSVDSQFIDLPIIAIRFPG